jgi:hypothetical protein
MRLLTASLATVALLGIAAPGQAGDLVPPKDIQSTFFNGQAFTASTPSNIKYTMTATPDGKIIREPVGKSGVKGEGTWKLSKDGFCTAWKGSKSNCFRLITGDKQWSVMSGTTAVAYWTK